MDSFIVIIGVFAIGMANLIEGSSYLGAAMIGISSLLTGLWIGCVWGDRSTVHRFKL